MKPALTSVKSESIKQDTSKKDTLIKPMELMPFIEQKKPIAKSVKVEIPVIGSIESDSGNHMMDIGTVLVIFVALFIVKKLISS